MKNDKSKGQPKKSIYTDLTKLDFPEDVKLAADQIYKELCTRIHRQKRRKQLLAFCVISAHVKLFSMYDPIDIGTKFGLTKKDINESFTIFGEIQTGFHIDSIIIDPSWLIYTYGIKLNFSESLINEMYNYAISFLDIHTQLREESPRNVAAGIIKYYIITRGYKMNTDSSISNVASISDATMNSMYNKIRKLDNK